MASWLREAPRLDRARQLRLSGSGRSSRPGAGDVAGAPCDVGVLAGADVQLDAVHPAHAFSEHFADERGNCFSCHSISPEGAFDVISGSLEVNEKGVPEPPPSEE